MMTKRENQQIEMHLIIIEDLVPVDHLLWKVNDIIDFSFIYDEVEDLYCSHSSRPSIDPVVLIKFLLIGFLYGINSERRVAEEIQVNMAYRWFLGLDIMDKVPDHSTVSQNRRRRFNGSDLFRNIFQKIVTVCIERDLVDTVNQNAIVSVLYPVHIRAKHNLPAHHIHKGNLQAGQPNVPRHQVNAFLMLQNAVISFHFFIIDC